MLACSPPDGWRNSWLLARDACCYELLEGNVQTFHEDGGFRDGDRVEVEPDVEMVTEGNGGRVHRCSEERAEWVVGRDVCARPAVVATGAGKERGDEVSAAGLNAHRRKQDRVRQEVDEFGKRLGER
jgi:hypothetical protein